VHFEATRLTDEEIGWRAAAAALSDLAAAAATPAGVLVACTVTPGTADERVVAVMRGVGAMARTAGTVVLGGNLSAGPVLSLTTTVLGFAPRRTSRVGARLGDGVWVSGLLGGARAAVLAWRGNRDPSDGARSAFVHPQPRLRLGSWLAGHGVTAMIDVSDGLGGDAAHLAAASSVRLEIDLGRLAIHPSVHEEAARAGVAAAVFAATGGEDYELLFTMPGDFDDVAGAEAGGGVTITRIGTVVGGEGVGFLLAGQPEVVAGYRHG
jgi:thiamine-monophosphate kinase